MSISNNVISNINKNYMLELLRKISVEQRKEIFDILDKEEQLEKDALMKIPNYNLEKQLKQISDELIIIRQTQQQCVFVPQYNSTPIEKTITIDQNETDIDSLDNYSTCSMFSVEWWPVWMFLILFVITILTPPPTPRIRPFSL